MRGAKTGAAVALSAWMAAATTTVAQVPKKGALKDPPNVTVRTTQELLDRHMLGTTWDEARRFCEERCRGCRR